MMTFLAAHWLFLLVAVAALAAAYVAVTLRRKVYAVRFTNLALLKAVAPRTPGWRRHVAAAAFLLSLAALVTALARPATFTKVPRERATVMVAIDVSLSMQADDVRPSRIAAAKSAARQFVAELPRTFNVGLVSFAGTASVAVSPTKDHSQVAAAIQDLTLAESTATGEAIFAALGAIKAVPPDGAQGAAPGRIVLLSDGYRTVGRGNDEAAAAAKAAHVPVSTIAFGTDEGTVELRGQQIQVPVDRAALRQLAESTAGKYYSAASGKQLRAVYQDLGSSIGYRRLPRESTTWFLGLGLLCAFAAGAMSLLWTSRLP
ncbi:MAG: VWA domain-containing protein [Actinomycetota bacterium]|nr:VWA domain-containing protein [Actinomycetota bacterium]